VGKGKRGTDGVGGRKQKYRAHSYLQKPSDEGDSDLDEEGQETEDSKWAGKTLLFYRRAESLKPAEVTGY